MSEPIRIEAQLFDEASAEEPPARIQIALAPDAGTASDTPAAATTTAATEVDAQPQDPNAATLSVVPTAGVAIGWVVLVIAFTQCVKAVLKLFGMKERMGFLRWRRTLMLLPVPVAVAMGFFWGPFVAHRFGFEFDPVTAALIVGVPSGAAAPWIYMLFQYVVLPLLPATTVGLIEKFTGIDLPDDLKDKVTDSGLFNSPTDVVEVVDD